MHNQRWDKAMATTKTVRINRKGIDEVLTAFGAVVAIALIVMGGLAWWAYSFTTATVRTELTAQKIYFPAKGSTALASSEVGPYLNKYAGEQLVTGPQAQVFADHYIAVHLSEAAAGQTYAEVSAKAQTVPNDVKLQAQANTLFKGETLRGMLLNAYAFWTVGIVAQIGAIVCFVAAGIMALLTILGFWHMKRT
jgi:hypothetical protein